jgi:hypothetical protein
MINGNCRCGRKQIWPNLAYSITIFLAGLKTTTKPSARLSGIRAEILTLGPQNMKREYCPLYRNVC